MARELHAAFQQVAPDLGFAYNPWAELPNLERRLAVRACWQATQSGGFLAAVLVHYSHDHGPDGKPQCPGWTHAQAESR
jgi:hypothetical protein